MIENSMQQAVGQNSPDVTLRPTTVAMCPMAKMCERMEKARSGSLLMLAGALLIGLGVLIFIEPRVVVWLVGAVAILMGIMFFMMARFIGRLHQPSL